jgi:hypothetical protein
MMKKLGVAALFLVPFAAGCYAEAYPVAYRHDPYYGHGYGRGYYRYHQPRAVYVAPRPVYVAPPPPARIYW